MPDQRDVQQLIQSLTPSAVNNGNPNTVYNQPMPQGGYIPPTFDPGTNTWRVNPAPPAPTVNWQQLAMSQPQSWNWQQPAPQPTPVPPNPRVPGPTTPVATTPVPAPTTPTPVGNAGSSNSGPGGSIGCVVVDSFLSDYDRADEVEEGDEMFVIDPISYRKNVGRVSYSETKLMPCVRIMTESGITLDCSTTAPIADQFGVQVLAPNLLNRLIPVCDNGVFYLDRVSSIEDLGELEVRHITVEDNFFLAGKEKGKYLFHHNMKRIADADDPTALRAAMEDYMSIASQGIVYGGGVGGSPNTRGAMQAAGTWDARHGGTLANPATQWGMDQQASAGNGNYTPTGQGLVDAFGGSALPMEDGGCVVVDSYLSDYDRADEVQVGDTMSVVDPVKRTTSTGRVSYSETKLMPCVRITTESGIVLECSTTAPIADELGNQVLAPALLNKLIPVVDNGVHYLDRVASIEDIGDREVRHITVENNFFLAGKEKGRYVYHHNIKFDGNGVDLLGMMDSLNAQFGWSASSNFMGSSSPNTRGAMQANGTWDSAHGGTQGSPATQWGRDQQAAANGGGSAWNGSLTGNESTNPFAGSQIDAMLGNTQSIGDSGWMTNPGAWGTLTNASAGIPPSGGYDPYAGQQPYGTELYGPPTLQVGQDASSKWGDWRNWADLVIPGDAFQSGTGEWNGTNVALALADMAFGLPVSSGVNNMGLGNLMQGGQGWTADNARTNLQNQYQISSSEQRTQMVNALSERYNISAEQVRQYIGVQ